MNIDGKGRKLVWGGALVGAAVIVALASGGAQGGSGSVFGQADAPASEGQAALEGVYDAASGAQAVAAQAEAAVGGGMAGGVGGQGGAEQALEGLARIRQQQCQSGNQLACQSLPSFQGIRQQLGQAAQACRSGDRGACDSYASLSQRIFTAYSESAAVMRQGEQSMAQMDAWRAQMNRNAANSMANLQARAAAGQAAHEARQDSYAAMNRSWQAGQDSIDRSHGRTIDRIYEGTTMDEGGVQTRIPDGNVGYTDGYGNVIAVPEGRDPPDGWQRMEPTYAAPR